MYTAAITATDTSRADRYAEAAKLPGNIASGLEGIFSSANAPNPHDVAQTIVELLDTPPVQRPDPVVVGDAFGADVANSAHEPLQAQLVAGFGLTHLAKLKHARG